MTTYKATRYHIRRKAQTEGGDTGAQPEDAAAAASKAAPAAKRDAAPATAAPPAPAPAAPPAAAVPPAPPAPPRARTSRAAAKAQPPDEGLLFDNHEDGFGDEPFATAGNEPAPPGSPPSAGGAEATKSWPPEIEAGRAAIRAEGLTGRQLRTARRIAARHEIEAEDEIEAVRLLREGGIDPFQRGSVLATVEPAPGQGEPAEGKPAPPAAAQPPAAGRAPQPAPGRPGPVETSPEGPSRALTRLPDRLPQTHVAQPAPAAAADPGAARQAEVNHAAEIRRMQDDIARRRRRKLSLLFLRLFMFILLPTLIAGWYFASVATRQYGTKSEFAVHMAESPMAAGGMGGLLQGTAMATAQDSLTVQGYLKSRAAMLRLEEDIGFRQYFMGPGIDPVLRLADNASIEDGYKLYQSHILISYDPSEGIIRMEVIAPEPEISVRWSEQLISYAEEQVDQQTQRLREDAMRGARESYGDAGQAVVTAQERVLELQERYNVLSSETEVAMLTQQISALDTQLIQEKLALAQMQANAAPNAARLEPVKRRVATLEGEIQLLRRKLTEGEDGASSLAQIQGQLLVAQADVETRQMILAQSLQAMENSRIEANRQTRYLSTAVAPIAPDVPTYPRVFENTLVTMLILLGIYLMISMTAAILREQVSS